MKRKAVAPPPPEGGPLRRITFEATLANVGKVFTLDGDGEARLTLTVPESCAKPLTEAMAGGWLRNTVFIVTIAKPDTAG